MDPVAPVASTDADKEIEVLQAKLEAAKKRKAEEEQKKIANLADLLSSLSPESLVALKEKMASVSPEKKTELKVESLDKPHDLDEIAVPPVKDTMQEMPSPQVTIVPSGGVSSNPTMSQELTSSNPGNPTMSQDLAASKKKAQEEEDGTQLIHTLDNNEDIVSIAHHKLGWAISQQLEGILGGDYLESKNSNALVQIVNFLKTRKEENATHIADEISQYLNYERKSKKIEASSVEVKSVLRQMLDAIKNMADVNEAKQYVVNYLQGKEISEDDKNKMIRVVNQEDSMVGLLTYLYNSLLAYEGMRSKPIRSVMAGKECIEDVIKILSGAKEIEDLLKAREYLKDSVLPVEHIDRAIETWTTDNEMAKTHLDKQIKMLKDSLKLKAKFVNDGEKKTDSYWIVKNSKSEPVFKVTAAQAFGLEIVKNWDMFKSAEYGTHLENELQKNGVIATLEKHYPDAIVFDEGVRNILSSRQKVVAQLPFQTDMGVGESNLQEMDVTDPNAPVAVDKSEEIQKDKSAPALVSKEVSDELLAPTEKSPHIADLLVEVLSPIILGSEVNTPESLVQDLKALFGDDDALNIFLGKVKQKVYELGNAHEKVDEVKPTEQKQDEAVQVTNPENNNAEVMELKSKLKETVTRVSELKQANEELKETLKKTSIERSARMRAERAKKLSDMRVQVGIEDTDSTDKLMRLSSKEFLEKEQETIRLASKLNPARKAFVKEAGKLWDKGAFPITVESEDRPEPVLIKSGSKLDVSWTRINKNEKKEEEK